MRRPNTPRAAPPTPEVYRLDEVAAILAHTGSLADVHGRQRHAIVSTLRYTGMRSIELRTLRRDALDLDGGHTRVRAKGGRSRVVVLPAQLVPTLAVLCAEVRPQLPDSPLLVAATPTRS